MGVPVLPIKGKMLRRLPHVFSKVLELPLSSDADVAVEELSDQYRFVVKGGCLGGAGGGYGVKAHVVEYHPGVKKVVVRGGGGLLGDELELDVWRVRLPANAWAEAAKAVYGGGELVVTVPKSGGGRVKEGMGCNEERRAILVT